MNHMRTRPLTALALLTLAACGGENLFQDPSAPAASDRNPPTIEIVLPDSGQRVAVRDSILVTVRATDNRSIEEIELTGFALRGSRELGNQTKVERFTTKLVTLAGNMPATIDTTVSRYLIAAADTLVENDVLLVARVRDDSGNFGADTVRINIGGPRVHIMSPAAQSEARAGTQLRVRIAASDSRFLLQSVRLVATGEFAYSSSLDLIPSRASVDTVFTVDVPSTVANGTVRLQAVVRNAVNDSAASPPIVLRTAPAVQDLQPPTARFTVSAQPLSERTDSLSVTVVGKDNSRMDRVGVTLVPTHRLRTGVVPLTTLSLSAAGDSATFRVGLDQLGVPLPIDTSTVRIQVTAFAIDAAGNCGTATVPNMALAEGCTSMTPVLGVRQGAAYETKLVRGRTVALPDGSDRIADLAVNGTHVFLSNINRNRVDVLPIGSTTFAAPISVGSRPWGLAFNRDESLLYVANSGGTNISVVSPSGRNEIRRIQTPNMKVYDVTYEAKLIPVPGDTTLRDSMSALYPTTLLRYDYSDRPQYIGVTQNENLIFSTVPTAAARDGTVRVWRNSQQKLEMVTEYAEERIAGRVVVLNADSAFLVEAKPEKLIRVCPRTRSDDPNLDHNLPRICLTGAVNLVQDSLEVLGYDTRFLYNMNAAEIGLADTTFVATSGNHSTVAVGEGARNNGRVMTFVDPAGATTGPLMRHGEVRDLVGNTAERLVGLALNQDGSLGMARGREAYFFSLDLRLQGIVETDLGGGGIDMHPNNPGTARSFVSGVTPDGLAFIDVMDTFHFRRVARIFLRDPVTGPVRAVYPLGGGLKLFAVTRGGIVAIDVSANDL
jgi:hypothetical protein